MLRIGVLLGAICLALPAAAQPTSECDKAWAGASEALHKAEDATKRRMAKTAPLPDQCGATREMLQAYQKFGKVTSRCEFVTGIDVYAVADGTADEVRRLENFMTKKCAGLAKIPITKEEKPDSGSRWSVQKISGSASAMAVQKFDLNASSQDSKATAVMFGCVAQSASIWIDKQPGIAIERASADIVPGVVLSGKSKGRYFQMDEASSMKLNIAMMNGDYKNISVNLVLEPNGGNYIFSTKGYVQAASNIINKCYK